ncbi:hypothetical protein IVB33_11390 [Bradyrhizobium sp. 24]|nr:hypothetical protein [Bradyrhizobium sp. 24]
MFQNDFVGLTKRLLDTAKTPVFFAAGPASVLLPDEAAPGLARVGANENSGLHAGLPRSGTLRIRVWMPGSVLFAMRDGF